MKRIVTKVKDLLRRKPRKHKLIIDKLDIEGLTIKCLRCGLTISTNAITLSKKIHPFSCTQFFEHIGSVLDEPCKSKPITYLQRVLSFSYYMLRLYLIDRSLLSQSEINKRFSICSACTFYNKLEGRCGVCGCRVNSKKHPLNKLAHKTTSCPKGFW